jgi:hypothetical protein
MWRLGSSHCRKFVGTSDARRAFRKRNSRRVGECRCKGSAGPRLEPRQGRSGGVLVCAGCEGVPRLDEKRAHYTSLDAADPFHGGQLGIDMPYIETASAQPEGLLRCGISIRPMTASVISGRRGQSHPVIHVRFAPWVQPIDATPSNLA